MNLADLLAALPLATREAPVEDLPALLGRLAEAEAIARLRIGSASARTMVTKPEADKNLSAEEAASRLGVSPAWLYKTKLPFKLKIGTRVLFSAVGLERWNRQRLHHS